MWVFYAFTYNRHVTRVCPKEILRKGEKHVMIDIKNTDYCGVSKIIIVIFVSMGKEKQIFLFVLHGKRQCDFLINDIKIISYK